MFLKVVSIKFIHSEKFLKFSTGNKLPRLTEPTENWIREIVLPIFYHCSFEAKNIDFRPKNWLKTLKKLDFVCIKDLRSQNISLFLFAKMVQKGDTFDRIGTSRAFFIAFAIYYIVVLLKWCSREAVGIKLLQNLYLIPMRHFTEKVLLTIIIYSVSFIKE